MVDSVPKMVHLTLIVRPTSSLRKISYGMKQVENRYNNGVETVWIFYIAKAWLADITEYMV